MTYAEMKRQHDVMKLLWQSAQVQVDFYEWLLERVEKEWPSPQR